MAELLKVPEAIYRFLLNLKDTKRGNYKIFQSSGINELVI